MLSENVILVNAAAVAVTVLVLLPMTCVVVAVMYGTSWATCCSFVADELCGCCRDAWYRLGNMSSQEAMSSYVEELKKVRYNVDFCYHHRFCMFTLCSKTADHSIGN